MYKKFLGGVLIALRRQIFAYLKQLEKGKPSHALIEEILSFLEKNLAITPPVEYHVDESRLAAWVQQKLNRPIRVCGMVRNVGEPGGGPFLIQEQDGATSLQILESSQIDLTKEDQRAFFEAGGYFNPVDLVCAIRDYEGQPFDLTRYVNPQTAFLSHKSLNGRELCMTGIQPLSKYPYRPSTPSRRLMTSYVRSIRPLPKEYFTLSSYVSAYVNHP